MFHSFRIQGYVNFWMRLLTIAVLYWAGPFPLHILFCQNIIKQLDMTVLLLCRDNTHLWMCYAVQDWMPLGISSPTILFYHNKITPTLELDTVPGMTILVDAGKEGEKKIVC